MALLVPDAFNCIKGLGETSQQVHGKYFFLPSFKRNSLFFRSAQTAGSQCRLLVKAGKFAVVRAFSVAAVMSRPPSSRVCFLASSWRNKSRRFCSRLPDNSTLPDRKSERLSERERMRGALFDSGNSAKGHRHQGNRRNEPRGFQVVLMSKLTTGSRLRGQAIT